VSEKVPLPVFEEYKPIRQNPFYLPDRHTLNVLNNKPWIASYSGGKDSTSLVTWIEWLRRTGLIKAPQPRLIQSDTEAEYPFLTEVVEMMISTLRSVGWDCTIVRPHQSKKLYNSIFGLGQTPINPAFKGMRWCTRQTKIGPMDIYKKEMTDKGLVSLTGVRWGESRHRDVKLKARQDKDRESQSSGCSAGGECGLPQLKKGSEEVFGPIITWHDVHVVKWLSGTDEAEKTNPMMEDLRTVSKRLLTVYHTKVGEEGLGIFPRKVHFMRFGCIGCPALMQDKVVKAMEREDPSISALRAIYVLWGEARLKHNRMWCWNDKKQKIQYGPMRVAVRKDLFGRLLEIQERSGVTIVSEADKKFIHKCWRKNLHPGKDQDKWREGVIPKEYKK